MSTEDESSAAPAGPERSSAVEPGLYVLDADGEPREEPHLAIWGQWFRDHAKECRLATDRLPTGALVTTDFLAIDLNYSRNGPPILWETCVVGGDHHGYKQRYSTEYAARLGHRHVVERLRAGTFEPYTTTGVAILDLLR